MKYKFVFCPGHPGVNSKGYIYEHILIAEKMLGRFLKPECQEYRKEYKTS